MATYFCCNPSCLKPVERIPSQVCGKIYCDRDCFHKARLTPCPFTPEELRRMHWDDELGMAPIAAKIDPPVTPKVARRWFKNAGIPTRDLAEHNRILAAKGYCAANAVIARAELNRKQRDEGLVTSRAEHMHTPEARERHREAMRKLCKDEMRACQRPGCKNIVTRKPAEFEEHWYCSKTCAGLNQKSGRYSTQQVFICENCEHPFVDYPSKRNQAHIYCSKECSGVRGRTYAPTTCDQCGNVIDRPPSQIRGEFNFCDSQCQKSWRREQAFKKAQHKPEMPEGYISISEALKLRGRGSREWFIKKAKAAGAYLKIGVRRGFVNLETLNNYNEKQVQEKAERKQKALSPAAPEGYVSINEAASLLKVSRATINNMIAVSAEAVQKIGWRVYVKVSELKSAATRQHPPSAETLIEIIAAYEDGGTVHGVASQFHVGAHTVRKAIIDAGGTIRPKGRRGVGRGHKKLTALDKARRSLPALQSEELEELIRAAQERIKEMK